MAFVVSVEAVRDALATVMDPELHEDIVSLGFVRDIQVRGADVSFALVLTTPACPLKDTLKRECERALREHMPSIGAIDIRFAAEVHSDQRIRERLPLAVGNILAVSSGKGGVGKTMVSVNLAVALAQEGARVGLLDADIYGPNVPLMMGLAELPPAENGKLVPARAFDVEVMSMGFLIPADQALVWRGPMLHGTIRQLFTEVRWGQLDYLVVDLPPGTGDAQLSLAQLVPLTGGIIVTTPQAASLGDAVRGLSAFRQLGVPTLGVVENMSGDVFGRGGGERVAREFGVEFLGSIELDPDISRGGDEGRPIVVEKPGSASAAALRAIARRVAAALSVLARSKA